MTPRCAAPAPRDSASNASGSPLLQGQAGSYAPWSSPTSPERGWGPGAAPPSSAPGSVGPFRLPAARPAPARLARGSARAGLALRRRPRLRRPRGLRRLRGLRWRPARGDLQLLPVLGFELDLAALQVLLELPDARGAEDRGRDLGPPQHPGERHLARGSQLAPVRPVGEPLRRRDVLGSQRLLVLEEVLEPPAGAAPLGDEAARVLVGEDALEERRKGHEADPVLLAERHVFLLDPRLQQVVTRLARYERVPASLLLDRDGPLREPRLAVEVREPDVASLAHPDQVLEGTQRLLDRSPGVRRVRLVEVHVVEPEAHQAPVHGVEDVLAREPRSQRPLPDPSHHLGRDHDLLARDRLERGPERPLRAPTGVDVGGVEQVDPELEGAMDDGTRLDVVDRAAVRGPGADRDLGDLEAGVAERAVVHRPSSDREKTAASIVPAPALHG